MADNAPRDQILTHFMECTNIDDFDTAMQILTQHNWNLLEAIRALHAGNGAEHETHHTASASQHSTGASSGARRHHTIVKTSAPHDARSYDDDNDDIEIVDTVPGDSKSSSKPSANRTSGRTLRFDVKFKGRTEQITISENEIVLQLRKKIAEKLAVQPNKQNFTNWMTKRYDDRTILKDLNLPQNNTINLIATASSIVSGSSSSSHGAMSASSRTRRTALSPARSVSNSRSGDFPITVRFEEKTGRVVPYDLHLEARTTIGELKREMEKLCHVEVAQQNWSGLGNAKDSDSLSQTSLSPKATLSLRRKETSSPPSASVTRKDSKPPVVTGISSDNDYMDVDSPTDFDHTTDYETPIAMSHTTMPSHGASNRELLIPENCTDDTAGLENFLRVFHSRYQSTGPFLCIGGLDDAIQAAFYAPVHERRPLAIYIHLDRSICANVFCTQVMADDGIIEYLAQHYIVWAWDFTSELNQKRFVDTFRRCVNGPTANRLAAMKKDVFPLIVILTRSRGSIDILQIIEGQQTKDEVFASLIQCSDEFNEQRNRDVEDERQREERENLKKVQEEEYHQSVQTDLAKEAARKREEFKQKEELRKAELLEQKRLKEQQQCQARLPDEPNETEPNIATFKIRLPDNQGILKRRFRTSDPLQILFDYLSSQQRMFGEYRLLTTYPKRDLTSLNPKYTLEHLKLYPQEQLILENI